MAGTNNVVAIITKLLGYIFILFDAYLLIGASLYVFQVPENSITKPAYQLCYLIIPVLMEVTVDYYLLFAAFFIVIALILVIVYIIQSLVIRGIDWLETLFIGAVRFLTPVFWLKKRGEDLVKAGNYADAATKYRAILAKRPRYPDANYSLGYSLMQIPDYIGAVNAFEEEIAISPDHMKARLNIGYCYIKLAMLDRAITELEEAVKMRPDLAAVHFWLGNAYHVDGRHADAGWEYREARKIDPDFPDIDMLVGEYYLETGVLDVAIALLKMAVMKKPESDRAHFKLGLALSKKNKHDEAVVEYEEAVRINPGKKEYTDTLEVSRMMPADKIGAFRAKDNREIVKLPCKGCGTMIEVTLPRCPVCGAPVSHDQAMARNMQTD